MNDCLLPTPRTSNDDRWISQVRNFIIRVNLCSYTNVKYPSKITAYQTDTRM